MAVRVLRLDARLDASGLSAGWQSRCDLTEAVRALLLDGQLVDVGDLVLHDAGMDVRHPTHELTRGSMRIRGTPSHEPSLGAHHLATFPTRREGLT